MEQIIPKKIVKKNQETIFEKLVYADDIMTVDIGIEK